MEIQNSKLLCFDLDGTLTQHKTLLSAEYKKLLFELSKHYHLLIVGAGSCKRIYAQMNNFPIDIIGNYGMQYSTIDHITGNFILQKDISVAVDIPLVINRANILRKSLNLSTYAGETIEIHPSGMLTFPILGTKAAIEAKLTYDPTRTKRRTMYNQIISAFPEYKVYIGGSSSFDIVPHPYSKLYALNNYCTQHDISHSDVLYFGDDYGTGGNDEDIYLSDIPFQKVDNYHLFKEYAEKLL